MRKTDKDSALHTRKIDIAREFKRSRPTIDKWIRLAIEANEDFASAYIYQYERFGQYAPLNIYQVWVLRALNNFQIRSKAPKLNKTEAQMKKFLSKKKFTLKNFMDSISSNIIFDDEYENLKKENEERQTK